MEKKLKVIIGISTYNAEHSALGLLSGLKTVDVDGLIVTDDCSWDKTPIMLKASLKDFARCHLILHDTNKGVGYVLKEQINYAIQHNYDIFVAMAGNGKDNIAEADRLIKPIIEDGFDYIQGSRFLDGGSYDNLPFVRKLLIKTYTWVIFLFTGFLGTDATNGFRAYRLDLFNDPRIDINQDWLDHYEFETYLHYKVTTLGYKVKEVAVSKNYVKKVRKYSYIKPFYDWWIIMRPLFLLKFGLAK